MRQENKKYPHHNITLDRSAEPRICKSRGCQGNLVEVFSLYTTGTYRRPTGHIIMKELECTRCERVITLDKILTSSKIPKARPRTTKKCRHMPKEYRYE